MPVYKNKNVNTKIGEDVGMKILCKKYTWMKGGRTS